MGKSIGEAISYINEKLEEAYNTQQVILYRQLKDMLVEQGFSVNYSIGSKHMFVTIQGYLEIKCKRKKLLPTYSRLSTFTYTRLVVEFKKDYLNSDYSIEDIKMLKQKDVDKVRVQHINKVNSNIDKYFDALEEMGITAKDVNTLTQLGKEITQKMELQIRFGKLTHDRDYYKLS